MSIEAAQSFELQSIANHLTQTRVASFKRLPVPSLHVFYLVAVKVLCLIWAASCSWSSLSASNLGFSPAGRPQGKYAWPASTQGEV